METRRQPEQDLQNLPKRNHRDPVNTKAHTAHVHRNTALMRNSNARHALRVYYTNVDNSLLSKYDELNAIAKDYDVIALNEIKPKNGSVPNLEILQLPWFDLFTNDLQQ